jgi:outer membrane protein TolC
VRRITLEQVKQSVDPAQSAFARLGRLSIEAAKQHRLGVQADYYPKFGATFVNVHTTEFLGQILSIRRPILGSVAQVPIPLIAQNQTIAALTFTQPLTPLLQVHQAVRIARADERIAMAKAGVSVTKNALDRELEETYFKLLIVQCKLTAAQFRSRKPASRALYAATSSQLIRASDKRLERPETNLEFSAEATEVRQLATSLNRLAGWPDDTELELVPPKPLVENVSLEEVAAKSLAANPDVMEAEQTVVKARAASMISKLEYIPTVAAVSGYLFQNAIPSVLSNFGYGGVVVSYNLFDFGKRERAVKEAHARVGMAEIALQMTKARVATDLKNAYFELERSRQVSKVAQKMGSSAALLVRASANPDSIEVKAARAEVEVEMLEADLAHRQAFARMNALMGLALRDSDSP